MVLPALIAAGEHASRRFVELFTANIRNRNTREAYSLAINAFLTWCYAEVSMALDMIRASGRRRLCLLTDSAHARQVVRRQAVPSG
jgi:FMN phosphatase YigB (HAD superfamily)